MLRLMESHSVRHDGVTEQYKATLQAYFLETVTGGKTFL